MEFKHGDVCLNNIEKFFICFLLNLLKKEEVRDKT
jgi:hypothetical protein